VAETCSGNSYRKNYDHVFLIEMTQQRKLRKMWYKVLKSYG